jgi:hypothetical protein
VNMVKNGSGFGPEIVGGEVVAEDRFAVLVDQRCVKLRRRNGAVGIHAQEDVWLHGAAHQVGVIDVQRGNRAAVNGRGDELRQVVADGLRSFVAQHAAGMDVATDEDDAGNFLFADELLDRRQLVLVGAPVVRLQVLLIIPDHAAGQQFEWRGGGEQTLLQPLPFTSTKATRFTSTPTLPTASTIRTKSLRRSCAYFWMSEDGKAPITMG